MFLLVFIRAPFIIMHSLRHRLQDFNFNRHYLKKLSKVTMFTRYLTGFITCCSMHSPHLSCEPHCGYSHHFRYASWLIFLCLRAKIFINLIVLNPMESEPVHHLICSSVSHPFFSTRVPEYRILNLVGSTTLDIYIQPSNRTTSYDLRSYLYSFDIYMYM